MADDKEKLRCDHPAERDDYTARCPICRQHVEHYEHYFPFCSDRCKLIDLGQWLKGDYQINRPLEQRDIEESD